MAPTPQEPANRPSGHARQPHRMRFAGTRAVRLKTWRLPSLTTEHCQLNTATTAEPPLRPVRPRFDDIRPTSQNRMKANGHHRKPEHIHAKGPGQKLQQPSLPRSQTASLLSLGVAHLLPLPPMLAALPGEVINPAQKPTPHAPICTVHDLNFTFRQHLSPIYPCHARSPIVLNPLHEGKSIPCQTDRCLTCLDGPGNCPYFLTGTLFFFAALGLNNNPLHLTMKHAVTG